MSQVLEIGGAFLLFRVHLFIYVCIYLFIYFHENFVAFAQRT